MVEPVRARTGKELKCEPPCSRARTAQRHPLPYKPAYKPAAQARATFRPCLRCGLVRLVGYLSPLNRNSFPPAIWSDVIVGQTNFSTCSTISRVPSKWLTYGGIFGLYMVSVRSRTRATVLPFLAICRRPNGRPSTHMFVC